MDITVTIDGDTLLNMLVERVEYWTDDDTTRELFETYYSDLIESGAFDGCDFDPMVIVDNDYINNFTWGTREEVAEEYGELDEGNIMAEVDDNILYLTY